MVYFPHCSLDGGLAFLPFRRKAIHCWDAHVPSHLLRARPPPLAAKNRHHRAHGSPRARGTAAVLVASGHAHYATDGSRALGCCLGPSCVEWVFS